MAGAPVAGEGGRQRRLARRELIRGDCLRPLQACRSSGAPATSRRRPPSGRGARRASVPRPAAGDRPAGARRRLPRPRAAPGGATTAPPRPPRPKRGPCPPVGPPAAPRRAGRAAGGGPWRGPTAAAPAAPPSPPRPRRRPAARASASPSAAAFAAWSARRASASSARLARSSRASVVAAWRRRAVSSSCIARAKVSAVPASRRARCSVQAASRRARLSAISWSSGTSGAPGQGVARPARRLRVSGCLPLAGRRGGAIALGALQRLGHRLDLRDLGKPRLRRRPPVGRQAGGQVGGGRLGRPLGAESVVGGVGIATPGLQGVLQAVEALGRGDRLARGRPRPSGAPCAPPRGWPARSGRRRPPGAARPAAPSEGRPRRARRPAPPASSRSPPSRQGRHRAPAAVSAGRRARSAPAPATARPRRTRRRRGLRDATPPVGRPDRRRGSPGGRPRPRPWAPRWRASPRRRWLFSAAARHAGDGVRRQVGAVGEGLQLGADVIDPARHVPPLIRRLAQLQGAPRVGEIPGGLGERRLGVVAVLRQPVVASRVEPDGAELCLQLPQPIPALVGDGLAAALLVEGGYLALDLRQRVREPGEARRAGVQQLAEVALRLGDLLAAFPEDGVVQREAGAVGLPVQPVEPPGHPLLGDEVAVGIGQRPRGGRRPPQELRPVRRLELRADHHFPPVEAEGIGRRALEAEQEVEPRHERRALSRLVGAVDHRDVRPARRSAGPKSRTSSWKRP